MNVRKRLIGVALLCAGLHTAKGQQSPPAQPATDSVSVRITNLDLRAAVQILGQYLDRPVLFSGQGNTPVSLEAPLPVPRPDVIRLLRGLLESQNFELLADTASRLYRARPKETVRPGPSMPDPQAPYPRAQAPGAPELFMLPLRHARAIDVAATVNALYGRGTGVQGDGRIRPQTLADELRNNQLAPVGGPPAQNAVLGTAGRSAALTGDLMIVADASVNSLLVRANRNDFELIQAIVRQLDVRPLQVLIEVLIAELRRDRSLDLGVESTLNATTVGHSGATIDGALNGGANVPASGSSSGSTNGTATGAGELVMKVMRLGSFDLDAKLHVAAARGDVKILSRPVLIAANNQEANIVVGSQRPFVQLSRSLPTESAARDQVVQYKDVGTKLVVRPTISADGLVQLEVTQEVSNATTETAFNAPVISTRSVQTHLLVRDGQTVALGGLTDRQRDMTRSGVPVLSSLPLIGGLFGRASRRASETELFVFITPRVIRTDEDAAKLAAPMQERAGKISP